MTTPRLLRAWALTDLRPSGDVTLILLRVADLAAALFGEKRVLALGWAGENEGLFEHPGGISARAGDIPAFVAPGSRNSFQQPVSKCAC